MVVIADTSGLYSLLNEADSNNAKALNSLETMRYQPTTILVPWDVYVETINTIGKKKGHKEATVVARYLHETAPFVVALVTERSVHDDALTRFATQPQSVSFTDCIVMAMADSYNTKDIFGFDEAFAKNGYRLIA